MSRLFEALSSLKADQRSAAVITPPFKVSPPAVAPAPPEEKTEQPWLKIVPPTIPDSAEESPEPVPGEDLLDEGRLDLAEMEEAPPVQLAASPESRLVAYTDPNSLGAEKFRALVTRFDHLRNQAQLQSFQVTSSVINEGKTLVTANVAVTLAKYSGLKTLLVEGDLHRPKLASLLGLEGLPGLSRWWSNSARDLESFVHRVEGLPLWFLPAGNPWDQPSELLRSARFREAFTQLAGRFEWTVVDSAPMLPTIDVNLWSRLLDGTLLVVREGTAPVRALKRGLQALDHPKLIGVVINEASESDHVNYKGQYYGTSDKRDNSGRQKSSENG